jgi:hypothetical protein
VRRAAWITPAGIAMRLLVLDSREELIYDR